MRNLFAYGVIAAAGLTFAACGGDDDNNDTVPIDAAVIVDTPIVDATPDSPTIDAMEEQFDYTCATAPAPAVAASIMLSGTTQELSTSPANLPSVSIAIHSSTDTVLNSTTSDATTSAYSVTVDTGGTAFAGSVHATKTAYERTVIYPPYPLGQSFSDIPTLLVKPGTLTNLGTLLGVMQDNATKGLIFVLVTDCAGNPVAHANVSAKQNGADVGEKLPLEDNAFTASAGKGVTVFANVPPGATQITATQGGHTFLAHTVTAYKADTVAPDGTLTQTVMAPGYLPQQP